MKKLSFVFFLLLISCKLMMGQNRTEAPLAEQKPAIEKKKDQYILFAPNLMTSKLLEVQLKNAFTTIYVYDLKGQKIQQEVLIDLQENTIYLDLFDYSGVVNIEAYDLLHGINQSESIYIPSASVEKQKEGMRAHSYSPSSSKV